MASLIDVTKPQDDVAYAADMRANFATAAAEISVLQDQAAAAATTGMTVIGTPPSAITISVGQGVPGGATPGFDQAGSQYTDTTGTPGALVYVSAGDGSWTAIA